MAAPDLSSVAFPRLDEAHMAALERCAGATLRHYGVGDKLIERVSRPGRRGPAGLHRPPSALAAVGGLHGPAGDRVALYAGHLAHPRLPDQEPGAVAWLDLEDDPEVSR